MTKNGLSKIKIIRHVRLNVDDISRISISTGVRAHRVWCDQQQLYLVGYNPRHCGHAGNPEHSNLFLFG